MLEGRCACSEISWLVVARLSAVGQGWILEMGSLWHHGIAHLLSRVL